MSAKKAKAARRLLNAETFPEVTTKHRTRKTYYGTDATEASLRMMSQQMAAPFKRLYTDPASGPRVPRIIEYSTTADHTRRIRRLASRKRVPIGQAIELYRGRHGYHRPSQISDVERAAWAAKGYPKQ